MLTYRKVAHYEHKCCSLQGLTKFHLMPFPKIELKADVPTLGSGHRCRVQPLFLPNTLTNKSTLCNLVKAKHDPKEGMAAVGT